MRYYPINEKLARKALQMNSHDKYIEGSATAAYRQAVDEAVQLAEARKKQVPVVYHEKIDQLLDNYARALAKNTDQKNAIAARLPSVLFNMEGLHFPADQIERQRRAAEANQRQLQRIQGALDIIRRFGKGRISADAPENIQRLEVKLERLEELRQTMKAVNVYYLEHKTLDGCPGLSAEEAERLKADMSGSAEPLPYKKRTLVNNCATIIRTQNRIEELTARREDGYVGWSFKSGTVEIDQDENWLRIMFDKWPDIDALDALKDVGFHWIHDTTSWRRVLTDNAIQAADRLECIRPLCGKLPSELQKKKIWQAVLRYRPWCFYIRNGTEDHNLPEYFVYFKTAKDRFQELRSQLQSDRESVLALGMESTDGLCTADILHVRQGRSYLVDDFTRIERMRTDPAVSKILNRIFKKIGFDRVWLSERTESDCQLPPDIPFAEWDNLYFPSVTPGSLAAGVYDLAVQCGSVKPEDAGERSQQISKLVRLLQSGNQGVRYVQMMALVLAASAESSGAVHKNVDQLMEQFSAYQDTLKGKNPHHKKKKTQERQR